MTEVSYTRNSSIHYLLKHFHSPFLGFNDLNLIDRPMCNIARIDAEISELSHGGEEKDQQ